MLRKFITSRRLQYLLCSVGLLVVAIMVCILFIENLYWWNMRPSPELLTAEVTTQELINSTLMSINESKHTRVSDIESSNIEGIKINKTKHEPSEKMTKHAQAVKGNNSMLMNISKSKCIAGGNKSSTINETRHDLSETIKKLKSRTPGSITLEANLNFLGELCEYQISSVVDAFGVPNLNSSILSRHQFLACPGLYLLKRTEKFDGKIDVPKHFQNCKKMSFQSNGTTAALFSFPGSGNSWVRQLLETTTGIYTGALKDCDLSYINKGMIGEGVYTDNVIAVKTHFPYHENFMVTHKIIYIIRNPFDAILSEWNRKQSISRNQLTAHISTAEREYFTLIRILGEEYKSDSGGDNAAEWNKTVMSFAVSWREHVKSGMMSKQVPMLVVKYENLQNNVYGELKRMMEFLEFSYTEDDLQCTINSASTEGFHRKHNTSFDPYTPEQKQWIHAQITLANKALLPYNITY